MNILDENIIESQWQLIRRWRIPVRQIGEDIARKGIKDDAEDRGQVLNCALLSWPNPAIERMGDSPDG